MNNNNINPTKLISNRLRDVSSTQHASRLAECTTIESSLCSTTNISSNTNEEEDGIHPLAKLANKRSYNPQPPLDDGISGGGSSISCSNHFSGMNTTLSILERCAPHSIVVPENSAIASLDNDMNNNETQSEQRVAVWNAITTLSTLCDEINELEVSFRESILPSIVLFSADSEVDGEYNSSGRKSTSKKDILDEQIQTQRESNLLSNIGKFLPTLQLACNGTNRLKRLVMNMVMQLGGVQTPCVVPVHDDEQGRQEGVRQGSEENMSESASNSGIGGTSSNPNAGSNNNTRDNNQREELQPAVFGEGVPMFRLGKAICTALRLLISIDSAISSNKDLLEAWGMYKDVVMEWSTQKHNDTTTPTEEQEEFESFERMMIQLDYNLLSCRSFINAIEQNFDPNNRFYNANFPLYDEIKSILATLYGQYCERINTELETTERLDCVGVYGMYILYRHLLPPNVVPDVKLHKSLWSVFPAMCPIMEIYGPNCYFIPREFMMEYGSYKGVKGCSADIPEIRNGVASMVLKWDGSFKVRVDKIRVSALGWLARADSELSPNVPEPRTTVSEDVDEDDVEDAMITSSLESIEATTSCILRGIQILHSASILLRSHLMSHRALGLAYGPDHISCLISLIKVIKSIEKMLKVRRRTAVVSFQRSTLKMIAQNILKRFDKVRSFVDQCSSSIDFTSDSDRSRSITRVTACLTALEGVLKGTSSFSPIRRHAIAFSIAACMDTMILEVFTTDDLLAVEGHLSNLSQIASIEETLNQVCDCSFLYFYRDLIPVFVNNLYETNLKSSLLHDQLILSALSDPERLLKQVRHLQRDTATGVTSCLTGYQNFVRNVLKEEYAAPICEMIETNLRRAASGEKGVGVCLRKFITAPPLYVGQMKFYVKNEVEAYLDKTFYDACALNLNECNKYNQMRSLAKQKYSLVLADPHLPNGSLDQSVDFIDILRDLESFISKYNYNLIEQSFIERRPAKGAKHLNTMNIKTITASLRQHGLGVVSSAINACYKLLSAKFQAFTDFMANDNVKSLLSREFRWFIEQQNEGNTTAYPFDRATAFVQELKKLVFDSGSSNKLDECRVIISEMGNIIALARMIRAAKRRLISKEMSFLPCSETSDTTDTVVDEEDISEDTVNTAKAEVDNAMSNILHQTDTDFVRAFVNVFRGVVKKTESDNQFMRSFFCIIPALCLCFVETSLQGKEIMHKKDVSRDGYYTDDGFAVGLAFSLSVLGQTKMYEYLNWSTSIQNKYAEDEDDLIQKKDAMLVKKNAKIKASKSQASWFSSSSTEDINTLTQAEDAELKKLNLAAKRLEGNKREMAMLFFAIHGSQSLFKDR